VKGKLYHIVIVCGYGCHLVDVLVVYLNKVIDFLKENKPDLVIFCGGETQRDSAFGISEAQMMANYVNDSLVRFLSFIDDRRIFPFRIENDSYTTHENIRNASIILNSWAGPRKEEIKGKIHISIFCEATRAANVVMLSRHFMKDLVGSVDDITIETGSWERADPFKQVGNLIYNKTAIKFPWLGLAERERRRRVRRSEKI